MTQSRSLVFALVLAGVLLVLAAAPTVDGRLTILPGWRASGRLQPNGTALSATSGGSSEVAQSGVASTGEGPAAARPTPGAADGRLGAGGTSGSSGGAGSPAGGPGGQGGGTPGQPPAPGGGTPATPALALGFYIGPDPTANNYASMSQFISEVGRPLSLIQGFYSWRDSAGAFEAFPASFASYVWSEGAVPVITWRPGQEGSTHGASAADQPDFSLAQILSGRYDAYIGAWADQAKSFGHTVYVRLMHEMNIPSWPWSYGVNGNTSPAEYIAAWRHVVGIFIAEHVNNVQFIWCPGTSVARPPIEAFYPGDAWTSWVGLDGYNRLTTQPWRSFSDIFDPDYQALVRMTRHPIMIAETATVEDPSNSGAKANWISQAFLDTIPVQFPRIEAALYFDAPGRGYSYPLNSSPQAFAAFRQVAEAPEYQMPSPQTTLSEPH